MHFNFHRFVLCTVALTLLSGCAHRLRVKDLEPQEIETTLFLIGDAGEPDARIYPRALDSLKRQVSEAPGRSIVVFLGDNVYPNGVPLDSTLTWPDARRRLVDQMAAVPAGARAIFVPGNHDWNQGGPYGLYAVRLEERMIASLANGRDIKMLPGNGCPGPAAFEVGRLRLILLDTQWWLHEFIIRDEKSTCNTQVSGVTSALRELVGSPGTELEFAL